jgi:hypothetical protein
MHLQVETSTRDRPKNNLPVINAIADVLALPSITCREEKKRGG